MADRNGSKQLVAGLHNSDTTYDEKDGDKNKEDDDDEDENDEDENDEDDDAGDEEDEDEDEDDEDGGNNSAGSKISSSSDEDSSHVKQSHGNNLGRPRHQQRRYPLCPALEDGYGLARSRKRQTAKHSQKKNTTSLGINPSLRGITTSSPSKSTTKAPNSRQAPQQSSLRMTRQAEPPRRIGPDLNSDDELIYSMKEQGHRDEDVRDELIRQGRVKYVAKTISTRYGRIKRAIDKRETERLDGELSDWHEGDDDLLQTAYEEVAPAIEEQRKALDLKLWTETAAALKRRMGGQARFSRNACRDRFVALRQGTAEPPLELDPDQVGRMARRAQRQRERDAARTGVISTNDSGVKDNWPAPVGEVNIIQKASNNEQMNESTRDKDPRPPTESCTRGDEAKVQKLLAQKVQDDKTQESEAAAARQQSHLKRRQTVAAKLDRQRHRDAQVDLKRAREATERAAKAKQQLYAAEGRLRSLEFEQKVREIVQRRMSQALAMYRTS